MQSLHDAITAKLEEGPKRCKFGSLVDTMGEPDRSALQYAIKVVSDGTNPGMSRAWLTKLLGEHGFDIGKTAISDHIRKVCACDQASE